MLAGQNNKHRLVEEKKRQEAARRARRRRYSRGPPGGPPDGSSPSSSSASEEDTESEVGSQNSGTESDADPIRLKRVRPAQDVKAPPFPNLLTLDAWRLAVKVGFQSASRWYNNTPSRWIVRAFHDKWKFEQLGDALVNFSP